MSNVTTIEKMYAAFERGEIQVILDGLSEDVIWEYGINSTDIDWLQPRQGKDGVAQFFQSLNAIEFRKFQPKYILDGGNVVVGLIDFAGIVKATGKEIIEDDEVHIFYFNDRGQITKFRHRVDTHQTWQAYQVS